MTGTPLKAITFEKIKKKDGKKTFPVIICGIDITDELQKCCAAKGLDYDKLANMLNALSQENRKTMEAQLDVLKKFIGTGRLWRYSVSHLLIDCYTKHIPFYDIGTLMKGMKVVGDPHGAKLYFVLEKQEWERIEAVREKLGLTKDAFLFRAAELTKMPLSTLRRYVADFFKSWNEVKKKCDGIEWQEQCAKMAGSAEYNEYLAKAFLTYLWDSGVLQVKKASSA